MLGNEDRTVNEGGATSILMELIVQLGMYLGLFFKKNWVFRRIHWGHVQLKFNDYLLVFFYVLGTELRAGNAKMKKEKTVHNPYP